LKNTLIMEQNEQITTNANITNITNNFIVWFNDHFENETFLNLKIVDQNVPLPGGYRGLELVEGNLELEVESREEGKEDKDLSIFIVGTMDNMRKEWFNQIEYAREYFYEETQYDFPDANFKDYDQTWDDFVYDYFEVNGTTFCISLGT
jgi:hypothetical protein